MCKFKKKANIIIIIIIIAIIVAAYCTISNNIVHNSNVASGYVITKENENNQKYYINFRTLSKQGKAEEVKIEIKDENMWNLIEEDRTYFVNYEWTNNNIPILIQIEINDKFKDLYDENLKPIQ